MELGVVTWPHRADLNPAWMHEHVKQLKTRAMPFLTTIRRSRLGEGSRRSMHVIAG